MKEKTLKEVCELAGVTRRAVQGYEANGLVTAVGRNKYGYLLYDDAAVEKIKEIKQYQDFGFTVKEIRLLFALPRQEYLKMMERKIEIMQEKLQQIEINIEKAKKMIAVKM